MGPSTPDRDCSRACAASWGSPSPQTLSSIARQRGAPGGQVGVAQQAAGGAGERPRAGAAAKGVAAALEAGELGALQPPHPAPLVHLLAAG